MAGATLGQRIHAAMLRAGLKKTHLAKMVDVSWQAVHAWTVDQSVPTAENVLRIAEVTGVTVDELLGVATGQEPPFPAWDALKKTEAFRDLDDTERRTLAGIPWPPKTEPTLAAYLTVIEALRATKPRGS